MDRNVFNGLYCFFSNDCPADETLDKLCKLCEWKWLYFFRNAWEKCQ